MSQVNHTGGGHTRSVVDDDNNNEARQRHITSRSGVSNLIFHNLKPSGWTF